MNCFDVSEVKALVFTDAFIQAFHCMSVAETIWFFFQAIFTVWLILLISSSILSSVLVIPRTRRLSEDHEVKRWPRVAAVIPCYLPNEKDIIVETLDIIASTTYPGHFSMNLPYNTSHDLEIEQHLCSVTGIKQKSIKCERVEESTSKATNVMHALNKMVEDDVEVVVIFDADHHPERSTVERLVRALESNPHACCVQGAVLASRGHSFLRPVVGGMEWTGWNFYAPGMRLLASSAWFGGAGAAWRRDVLQEIGLDPSRMTEDIDASVRAMLKGHKIIVAPWARIHELCPSTVGIFLRQRLRWATGWEQVTWSTAPKIISARIDIVSKLRILSILTARYFGAFSGMFTLVNFVATTTRFVYEHQQVIALPIALLSSVSGVVSASAGVTIILVVLFNGEGRDQAVNVVSFLLFAPLFFIFKLYSILHSWVVLLCCSVTWVTTTRTANGKVHRIAVEPSKRHVHMPLDVVEPLEEA